MRKVVRFIVAFMLVTAGTTRAAQSTSPDDLGKMAVDLAREGERLEHLRQLYKRLDESIKEILTIRRGGLPSGKERGAALAHVPAAVITDNLRVERTLTDKGLVYRIKAKNVPVIQVFEAVAKTAGLRLEIHPDIGREHLLGRIWVDLRNAEINEALEIIAGTQSLGVTLDKGGILLAPVTALSDQAYEDRLHELAIESYHQALVRYPASAEAPWAYLGIARHYAATGFDAAAVETANRVVERYTRSPAWPEAMLFLASCHEKERRFDAARKVYRLYLDNNPAADNVALVTLRLGESWMREGKPSQAIPILEEVVRNWPKSKEMPLARTRLAECLVAQKQYERAVEQLKIVEAARERKVAGDELAMTIARCLVKLKRYESARARLLLVLKHSKSAKLAEEAYYGVGDIFLAEGKPVAALEAYTGAMRAFPDGRRRATAPISICRAYARMGLFMKVEDILTNLPESAWVMKELRPVIMALAGYYLEQGRNDDALQLMSDRRWPHDSETDAEVLLVRARALLANGTSRQALKCAKAAATLARDDDLRAAAKRVAGDCLRRLEYPVRAAMAYAGEIK